MRLEVEDLRPAGVVEHQLDHRRNRVHLFEVQLQEEPALAIDNREIIEARFVPLEETQSFALAAPFREYLERKATTTRNVSTQLRS